MLSLNDDKKYHYIWTCQWHEIATDIGDCSKQVGWELENFTAKKT
jgi:hypothetical protein